MKRLAYFILTLGLTLSFASSCVKEDPNDPKNENVPSETSVTGHAEDITALSATLICYANLSDVTTPTVIGVLYSLDKEPVFETAYDITASDIDANNQYKVIAKGLQPGKTYYFRSYVRQGGINKYGRVKSFSTKESEIIISKPAEKISAISASIPADLNLEGLSIKDARYGVCYSESASPEIYKDAMLEAKNVTTNGFVVDVLGLKPNTTYYYFSYAVIDGSLLMGKTLSFTTVEDSLATTNEPNAVKHISASLSGVIDLEGCSYQTASWGIAYSTNENVTIESDKISSEKLSGKTFDINLTCLTPNTLYYYRAYVIVDGIPHYGAILYFRTPELFGETSIKEASSVSASVSSNYNIKGVEYTKAEYGICYGTKDSPSISDKVEKSAPNEDGTIEIILKGLDQTTKYYVRPYAKLEDIVLYGESFSFETLGIVISQSSANVSAVSSDLTIGYDLENTVYSSAEFGVCYSTSSTPTVDKNAMKADISGESSITVTASALQSSTKYYFRGYAVVDGKTYYGAIESFTTKKLIGQSQAQDISPVSMKASISYDLDKAVYKTASFGVCVSTSATPTTSDISSTAELVDGAIVASVSKLIPSTTYNYRGYAVIDGVTHYGEIKQFATGENRFTTTGNATDITYCSASLSAKYNLANAIYSTVVYGICYSQSATPTIANSSVTGTPDGSGNLTLAINNLECSTEYYYRPFVTLDGATYYGQQRIFETAWDPFVVAELEAGRLVDLGLSVHWASYNVGATKPEDVGNPYAWGEVTTKDKFTWENYRFTERIYNGNPVLTKYTESSNVELSDDDDVACARLGGTYRMPRENEIQELIEKCRWEWTDVNSVKGYKITGPSGKSIFLPSKNFTVSGVELWHGYYWSKTRYSDSYSSTKWGVCILTSGVTEQPSNNSHSKYYHDRYDGFYVRPVSSY